MSISFDPTPPSSQSHAHSFSYSHKTKEMTISYSHQYHHDCSSHGLITPPYEMRSATDLNSMDASNILVPASNTRYNLRKHPQQPYLYPLPNDTYQNNNYNPYVHSRERSTSSSSQQMNGSAHTLIRPSSPSFDFESRDFNVGEFTASMTCFLWFEPLGVLDYAASSGEHLTQLQPLADDSIVTPDFIDFCTRVIKTTAVSKEVAILGLLYIRRLRLTNPGVIGLSGSQWRIFTIALMLGNKILDDNTYTNKTWADVTKILHVHDIKVMELEFCSQMRWSLFVSPQQWEEWKSTLTNMYLYLRECQRHRLIPNKRPSIPPSPPVSSTATSPSFTEQPQYMPPVSTGSPFRMHYAQLPATERMMPLPIPMDDSPSSASAVLHARVSQRKRSREEPSLPSTLQPPSKRFHPYHTTTPTPLGIQIPVQSTRQPLPLHTYPTEMTSLQQYATPSSTSSSTHQKRSSLTLTLPDTINTSPLIPFPLSTTQQYLQSTQPISPSYPPPSSPYAPSPLSPFSTSSNFQSVSPYTSLPHHTPMSANPQVQAVAQEGFSSPYKYLQNRYSPYAPVRPVRTLPSQFIPPRMQWSTLPVNVDELYYHPLGQTDLRRGVMPTYFPQQ